MALYAYHDQYGELPPATTFDDSGKPLHGWMIQLFPYFDLRGIYDQIDQTRPWDDPSQVAFEYSIQWLQCSRSADSLSESLSPFAGNSRVFQPGKSLSLNDVTDSKAHTLLVGEVNEGLSHWGAPGNVRDPALGFDKGSHTFGSPNKHVVVFSMADGSVTTLSKSIDPFILNALATPNDGENLAETANTN